MFSARLVTTSRESFGKYNASQRGSLLEVSISEGVCGGGVGTTKRFLEVGLPSVKQVFKR